MFNIYPFEYSDRSVSLFSYLYYDKENKLNSDLSLIDFNYGDDFSNFDLPEANIKLMTELSEYINKQQASGMWEQLWAM